jgi:hypothetical protein
MVKDVGSPQWGLGYRQLLAIIYVTLSHALFALGCAQPAGGFYLRTLSFGRTIPIVGPVLDTVVVSCVVAGMMCEELGRRVNIYNTLFYVLQGSIASPPRL